jgi:hypothetical protein
MLKSGFRYCSTSLLPFLIIVFSVTNLYAQPFQWAFSIGQGHTTSPDAKNIDTDKFGNVIISGTNSSVMDFDPGPGVTATTAYGDKDIFLAQYDGNGNLNWSFMLGWTDKESIDAQFIDQDGNIYISGSFELQIDLDPGPNVAILVAEPTWSSEYFIAKYDKDGNFLWGHMNIDGVLRFENMTTDDAGNIYFEGFLNGTAGTIDLDFGPGVVNPTTTVGHYIAKYDSNLNYLWHQEYGYSVGGQKIVVDANENVYISGAFGTSIDFDPTNINSQLIFPTLGNSDFFVVKYDRTGTYQWAFTTGSFWDESIINLAVDDQENVTICASIGGPVDFDPGPAVANVSGPIGTLRLVLARYDSLGNYQWANRLSGLSSGAGRDMKLDPVSGDIYVTGYYWGVSDFDPSTNVAADTSVGGSIWRDVFITHFDNAANYISHMTFGNLYHDEPGAIHVDELGNLFCIGNFQDVVDFEHGPGTTLLTSPQNGSDFFILKYGTPYVVSVAESTIENVSIYPNPSSGNITIELEKRHKNIAVQVLNSAGQLLLSNSWASASRLELNLEGLAKGMYFIRFQSDQKSGTFKVVKE